jgi:hypothetical protein
MKYFRTLLAVTGCLIVSCSSGAEDSFEKIVARVDKYFSGTPSLLTSNKVTKDGQQSYVYYVLKIDKYNLSYDVKNTYSAASPYSAYIRLSSKVSDNIKSGDLILDTSEFSVISEIAAAEASGFSTTSMALANNDFSQNDKSVTLIMRYSYQGDNWTYRNMTAGGASESLIRDLESFPQNKEFREAIGMEG